MAINWQLSDADYYLVRKIAERVMGIYDRVGLLDDLPKNAKAQLRNDTLLDITACHNSGCPLNLEALLHADEANFLHDVRGINQHIDHATGELTDFFIPRYAQ